jgi:hypothetical protein
VYPCINPSHIRCSRISLASLQNELTHFLQGHNILSPTAEFLNAKARKPFTPCKYFFVCLHRMYYMCKISCSLQNTFSICKVVVLYLGSLLIHVLSIRLYRKVRPHSCYIFQREYNHTIQAFKKQCDIK